MNIELDLNKIEKNAAGSSTSVRYFISNTFSNLLILHIEDNSLTNIQHYL